MAERRTTGSLGAALMAGALVAAATLVVGATAAGGTPTVDTGDHFSLPPGTAVAFGLKSGTKLLLNLNTAIGLIDVGCTTFSAKGTIPASGLKIAISPPTISGCTDNRGHTEAVTTNRTHGSWSLTEVDAANDDGQKEPNTGDQMSLTIPQGGATLTSTAVKGPCTLTFAPSANANVTGTYNDLGSDTVKLARIPGTTGGGCPTSPANATTAYTIVLSKALHDVG